MVSGHQAIPRRSQAALTTEHSSAGPGSLKKPSSKNLTKLEPLELGQAAVKGGDDAGDACVADIVFVADQLLERH